MTIGETYNELALALAHTGEGEAEAKTILAHIYGCSYSDLYLRFLNEHVPSADYDQIVQKRLSGLPLAYVLGQKSFYGRDFFVDKHVLIPRNDSECVVDHAIAIANRRSYSSAIDLCCGSGCLGLTLLSESGIASLMLCDVSEEALYVAAANSRNLRLLSQCAFIKGHLLDAVYKKVDIIICNPPYISAKEYSGLDSQVKNYEPQLALLAKNNGYEYYEKIIPALKPHLNPNGSVVFETGYTQADTVANMLESAGFLNVGTGCDLAARPRFVWGDRA